MLWYEEEPRSGLGSDVSKNTVASDQTMDP